MKRETHRHNETYGIVGRFDVCNQPPQPGREGTFRWRDMKHTRYNKSFPDSVAVLTIFDHPEGTNTDAQTGMTAPDVGWTEIKLEETTTSDIGRTVSRVISVALSHDARKALLAYLLKEPST